MSDEITGLDMPERYQSTIARWRKRINAD